MSAEHTPTDDTAVTDVDTEEPDPILTEEALVELTKGFGKGTIGRKLLVTKGVTLSELSRMGQ